MKRKNGLQLAERAGDATPEGMRRLLYSYRWNADLVRDDLSDYVVEHLGCAGCGRDRIPREGDKSAGVQRQYSGKAKRDENCQDGAFPTCARVTGPRVYDWTVC